MNIRTWIGLPMRHPDGREGVCIKDDNPGIFRILTVELDDGTEHEIWLSNIAETEERYRAWAWLYLGKEETVPEWVEFGP